MQSKRNEKHQLILNYWSLYHNRWQRRTKAAQEVEYPAYGITGPGPSPSGKSSLKSSPSSTTPGGGIGSWTLGKTPKSMASSGDKKLAHSAHMFHFQHQKQQVIALERFVIFYLNYIVVYYSRTYYLVA